MNRKLPKGLRDLATRRSQAAEAQTPHRRLLRVANLELRKELCNRVRAASRRRLAQVDAQLAEIAQEQRLLLGTLPETLGVEATGVHGPHGSPAQAAPHAGFTLKY